MNPENVTIRKMVKNDLDASVKLTESEGWDYGIGDFERLLYYEPDGCFVATYNNQLIGITTSIAYTHFAWIGNVIVDSQFRRAGIGKKIMETVHKYLFSKNIETLFLESTLNSVQFYRKLGYMPCGKTIKLIGSPKCGMRNGECGMRNAECRGGLGGKAAVSGVLIKKVENSELFDIYALDKTYFGDDRSRALKRLLQDFPDMFYGAWLDGKLKGYIIAKSCLSMCEIGPWIVEKENDEIAESLFQVITNNLEGHKVLISIPSTNEHSLNIVKKYGFEVTGRTVLMSLGKNKNYFDLRGIYAEGAGEKG